MVKNQYKTQSELAKSLFCAYFIGITRANFPTKNVDSGITRPSNGGFLKHFHCYMCPFVVKNTDTHSLKYHLLSIHGIQQRPVVIIPDQAEEVEAYDC